jgi:hypothetical protein
MTESIIMLAVVFIAFWAGWTVSFDRNYVRGWKQGWDDFQKMGGVK